MKTTAKILSLLAVGFFVLSTVPAMAADAENTGSSTTDTSTNPITGTKNSAGRVGVVSIQGGPTHWMLPPGDPRENYIARMYDQTEQFIAEHPFIETTAET